MCFHRMLFPSVRLCTRQPKVSVRVCVHSTLSKSSRPREKKSSSAVFQYVGQNKKPNHKVFVWGFSFTGALGIPSFVVPDSGRKTPRKFQLTPYRLETAEQVKSHEGFGSLKCAIDVKVWKMMRATPGEFVFPLNSKVQDLSHNLSIIKSLLLLKPLKIHLFFPPQKSTFLKFFTLI